MGLSKYGQICNWRYLGLPVTDKTTAEKGNAKRQNFVHLLEIQSSRFTSFFIRDILHPHPSNDYGPLDLSTKSKGETGGKVFFNLTAFPVPPCDNNDTCWIRPSPNTHVHCLQDILVEAPPGHYVNPKQQDSFPEIGKEKRKQLDDKGKLF